MQYRSIYHMPLCTNQNKSSHGYINSNTPRRNDIWHSIKRLIEQILKRNHLFNQNFNHNYQSFLRKIKRFVKNTPDNVMEAII